MKTFFELREQASELDEKLNVNKIHKAVDAGKSMDAIVGMFANRRTTNTNEIRKVVKDYKFKKRMKREEVELDEKMDPTKHVKKKGDKFCVYNADGSVAKEFDNKEDADKYAIANHDKMMATKEEVELEESMTGGIKRNDPKLVKIFDKLKKEYHLLSVISLV